MKFFVLRAATPATPRA